LLVVYDFGAEPDPLRGSCVITGTVKNNQWLVWVFFAGMIIVLSL